MTEAASGMSTAVHATENPTSGTQAQELLICLARAVIGPVQWVRSGVPAR
jgi:hypothetical protein